MKPILFFITVSLFSFCCSAAEEGLLFHADFDSYLTHASFAKGSKKAGGIPADLQLRMFNGAASRNAVVLENKTERVIYALKDNFNPPKEDVKAIFEIRMTDTGKTLIVDVDKDKLQCYYGDSDYADVVATTTRAVVNKLVNGRTTFQGAFMAGNLSAKGNFKMLRTFDQVFQFNII